MSELFALAERSGGGFSRDARFATASRAIPATDTPDLLSIAYAEGHAAGVVEARAAAAAEALAADEGRERFSFNFSRLDAELAEQLRHKMYETVVALTESALQPLALDAAALARRVEAAVAMFVRADDERVIRLHPDDLTLVAAKLPTDWQFVPDNSLERGGLRVESSSGGIEDGPLQWRAAMAEALRLC